MVFLVVNCLITWVIFLDSHSIGMKHKNLWVVGTFLLMPLVMPLYLIRRAQFLNEHKLTPRQEMEAKAREASRKRREKAQKARQQKAAELWREKQEDPAAVAAAQAESYKEKHEMRMQLDEQLSRQQERHAKQWGVHR